MRLYCVRHGEAELCQTSPDYRRPLTEKGHQDVLRLAQYLASCQIKIYRIVHSGKMRAEQTAEILAQTLHCSEVSALPKALDCEAEVEEILELLPFWTEDTLLVGHLPFMPRLINALLDKPQESSFLHFPPATIVCLEQQYKHWLIRWAINPDISPSGHFWRR